MRQEAVVKEKVCGMPRLKAMPGGWCPGCHYGVIHRLVCEVIDELGIDGRTIGVTDIGCNAGLVMGTDINFVMALHGRSLVVSVGIKRVHPEFIVYHAQGDGGLGAIGAGHFLNAMVRADKITTIFLNNAGYGMTGGQAAPTTLLGMRTATTEEGRIAEREGFPLHVAELAATMQGVAYAARVSVHTPANMQRAKRALRDAFEKQINNVGYSIVEFISACPTDWRMNPIDCLDYISETMLAEYPLGEFKNVDSIDYQPRTQMETDKR